MCYNVFRCQVQLEGHIINRKPKNMPVMAVICVLIVTAAGLDKACGIEPLFNSQAEYMGGNQSYEMT